MFCETTNLTDALKLEVFSRINGIDGIVAIIKIGARELGVAEPDLLQLNEALGNGVFKLLKSYRDAVVHSRIHNAPLGIGIRLDRRASLFTVLLAKEALDVLYQHLTALRLELRDAAFVIVHAKKLKELGADDPDRAPRVIFQSATSARFREHQRKRQSLPPLPEFPSEPQLKEARDNWFQAHEDALLAAVKRHQDGT
jgi:hypothetical protein